MSSLLLLTLLAAPATGFSPASLWDAWPQARFVETPAPCLRHAELVEQLRALGEKHAGALRIEEVGRSVQGRSIHLMTLGSGPFKVLLWSQMHGDEPSATPALLDVADYLLSHRDQPEAKAILERLTLLMVPMLNPDGAEPYERRNAQGIDINRDALNLVTPEGRLLKRLRDELKPELGFNLHDQNRRATVGASGNLASISLLAVAGDPQGTVTPGRERSRRVCSLIAKTLAPFVPGGIGRYDEDWSPRAFGDNLTAWGTPVVLIESGGLPPDQPLSELTRLNFVALLTVFRELARDDARSHGPEIYEALARNTRDEWSDVVVRGAQVFRPGLADLYRADVAFDVLEGDRTRCGCEDRGRRGSRVTDLGDARFVATGRTVDATGTLLAPAFVVGARGLEARQWLDGEALARLARLGVALAVWQVPAADRAAAETAAHAAGGRGRSAIVVVGEEAALPPIVLDAAPAREARALSEIEATLEPEKPESAGGTLAERLLPLAGGPGGRYSMRVASGGPASFVLLRPAASPNGGAPDAVIESVFLDGVEVPLAR